jgi:hypothetical protein
MLIMIYRIEVNISTNIPIFGSVCILIKYAFLLQWSSIVCTLYQILLGW